MTHLITVMGKLKKNRLNLFLFVIGLFCLHGFLCLIRLLYFNQGGAGHAEDTMDVKPQFDFHFGALARCLRDNFLDEELTCKEAKNEVDDALLSSLPHFLLGWTPPGTFYVPADSCKICCD